MARGGGLGGLILGLVIRGIAALFRVLTGARPISQCEAQEIAGREGETAALHAVREVVDPLHCPVYVNCRVARPGSSAKCEIDLIVPTPCFIFCVEAKSWGGEVEDLGNGVWRQINSRGERRDYEDSLSSVQAKAEAVRQYLLLRGVGLTAQMLRWAVVFTNARVSLGSRLRTRTGICNLRQLREVTRMLAFSDTAPRISESRKVADLLAQLPSWDYVRLRRGQLLTGDVVDVQIRLPDGRCLTRASASTVSLNRRTVTWQDWNGARFESSIDTDQVLLMRVLGRADDMVKEMAEIESIRLGYANENHHRVPPCPLGTEFDGCVTGTQPFGVFVTVPGRRDGLIRTHQLASLGKSASDFVRGSIVRVRLVRLTTADGDDRIDLDLVLPNGK